ncbi:erythromycin esterase [Flavobacterium cauense R2A-7]|uniref:Erythromycin esterase n=2 Tax=Flavobacterium TaxID=237 RepID=A0A562LL99_9FLAO|nr:erythromycin esterase [Flavobacterium cauense R2A-7]
MKNLALLIVAVLCISCNKKITTELSRKMIPLDSENSVPDDFSKLDQFIESKEIILLGEAAHGEGKTFEVKTQIVKYLVEKKGFNTIALEGMDFLQLEYINGRSVLKNNLADNFESDWYGYWNPWNPAKQLMPFETFIKSKKISLVGIESYQKITAIINIDFIKNELEKSNWSSLNKDQWEKLSPIFDKIQNNEKPLTIAEYDFFTLQLQRIIESNETIFFGDNFFTQMLENLITHVSMEFNPKTFSNEDEESAYRVRTRDYQMARNLIYFKERNPKAKIIVWLANFHGATNLKEVTFADGDPEMYSKFTVFGEHIKNKYSDKVYSIATTSTRGFSKMPYNKGVEETKIIAPKESLEFELDKRKFNFGYIDFREIYKKNPEKRDEIFNSIMLGHYNQKGKWLQLFDGLLYIKENEIALPKG